MVLSSVAGCPRTRGQGPGLNPKASPAAVSMPGTCRGGLHPFLKLLWVCLAPAACARPRDGSAPRRWANGGGCVGRGDGAGHPRGLRVGCGGPHPGGLTSSSPFGAFREQEEAGAATCRREGALAPPQPVAGARCGTGPHACPAGVAGLPAAAVASGCCLFAQKYFTLYQQIHLPRQEQCKLLTVAERGAARQSWGSHQESPNRCTRPQAWDRAQLPRRSHQQSCPSYRGGSRAAVTQRRLQTGLQARRCGSDPWLGGTRFST